MPSVGGVKEFGWVGAGVYVRQGDDVIVFLEVKLDLSFKPIAFREASVRRAGGEFWHPVGEASDQELAHYRKKGLFGGPFAHERDPDRHDRPPRIPLPHN